MLDRFHSKFHRYNHHTDYTPGYVDSASDPIASPQDPFKGSFHVRGTLSATSIDSGTDIRVGGTNKGSIVAPNNTTLRTYTLPDSSGSVILNSTITQYISSLSSSDVSTPYVQSSIVWVDSTSGNDNTGLRNRADKPFKTLNGAQSVAQAGDVIHVHSGLYSDVGLGANGVNWYFEPNARITLINPTTPIFIYSGMSYNVWGRVNISISGNIEPSGNVGLVTDFSGATGTNSLIFEFQGINISSTALRSDLPVTSIFKGTFGNRNIIIRGDRIYAPILCVFNGVKALNVGDYSAHIDISEHIVAQTIFYGSLQRLTSYITSPMIIASDYVYNDGSVNDASTRVMFEAGVIQGSILKDSTTGPIYFDAFDFYITPFTGSVVCSIKAAGEFQIFGNRLTTTIPISSGVTTYVDVNTYVVANSSVSANTSLVYSDELTFNANIIDLSHLSTTPFTLFYTNTDNSRLITDVGDILNPLSSNYYTVNVDDADFTSTNISVGGSNGGDYVISGINNRARINITSTPNSHVSFTALSSSTNSSLVVKGMINTLSANNISVVGLSGQSNTKLYVDSGTILTSTGTYNIDLSQFVGDPIKIYSIGTNITNRIPLNNADNFIMHCGIFESTSAVEVPVF